MSWLANQYHHLHGSRDLCEAGGIWPGLAIKHGSVEIANLTLLFLRRGLVLTYEQNHVKLRTIVTYQHILEVVIILPKHSLI